MKQDKVTFCSGLTSVIGYEPWADRAIESAKQSIADGVPILIRLHPGADYPCSDKSIYYKQDMEGHAVLLIGYDDETRMFIAIDPWNGEGEYGGIIELPYEIMPLRCMNATADKASRIAPPEIGISIVCEGEETQYLKLTAGYYLPLGYIIDRKENILKDLKFHISYNIGGQKNKISYEMNGEYSVDNVAEAIIPFPDKIDGLVDFTIQFSCIICGTRPYAYADPFNMTIKKRVSVHGELLNSTEILRFKLVA